MFVRRQPRIAFGQRRVRAYAFDRVRGMTVVSLPSRVCVVQLRNLYPLIEGSTSVWVHAARHGEFNGHPAGAFAFTDEIFGSIVKNFESQDNRVVPLTYDHPFYDGTPREKAGWVHKLVARQDGLWAWCELTVDAVSRIKSGYYRFASVVVVPESVHRESGEEIGAELYELALTDSPFIDGLKPIELAA